MIFWGTIIAALALLEILAIFFAIPQQYVYTISVTLLLVSIAVLYRTHTKVQGAMRERLEKEIEELREEIEELRQRVEEYEKLKPGAT